MTADGRSILFSAPVEGAYELWRMSIADGDVERLTEGRHYLSGWDAVPGRAAGSTRLAVSARARPSCPTSTCSTCRPGPWRARSSCAG